MFSVREGHFRSIPAGDATRTTLLDVYFDDRSWLVRYFVVDPGDPLPRRDVLVRAQDVVLEAGRPRIRLSHDALKLCPEVDDDRPFFLQHDMGARFRPGDPHLRSSEVTMGLGVVAEDGRAGHVRDIRLDGPPWRVSGIVLDTGLWLPGKAVCIDPAHVLRIDYIERTVSLRLTRNQLEEKADLAAA